MILIKRFKGQEHLFDLPDDQARKLLAKDSRYSKFDDEEKQPDMVLEGEKPRGRRNVK